MTIKAANIAKLVRRVTQKHARQIKAEERNSRARWSRAYTYSDRVNFTEVAARIFPNAYRLASGDGTLPASKRQIYYAAREAFHQATGRQITQQRCNMLLLQYMNTNRTLTASWRVTADPRGTLFIPNTFRETRIPCGTLDIDRHLETMNVDEKLDTVPRIATQWPTLAAGQRFRAVLYIEKEGFEPLLRQTRIAERFEIAVLSCKGQSVVAARKYVDHVCQVNGGVPLFVVHDFDVFGFFIAARLTSVAAEAWADDRVAYHFKHDINVTDFGLRLEDARKYGLADERCKAPKHIEHDLGCTDDEKKFFYSGRRIELNAFTAPQFVEWLEGKLRAAGLDDRERMIPPDDVLERAYRRCIVTVRTNKAVRDTYAGALNEAKEAKVPGRLRARLRSMMRGVDEPWDIVLHRLTAAGLGVVEPDDDDQADDVAAMAERLGIKPEVLQRCTELAEFTEAEIAAVVSQLTADNEEVTTDVILARLKRSRHKDAPKPRRGRRGKGK
jgi:hypothetical protein